jgi:hypothetical protein
MPTVKWLSCFWATALAGCSLYPIPDDVTSLPTEAIVRQARCEIRAAIIAYMIDRGIIAPSATEKEIAAFVAKIQMKATKKQKLNDIEKYVSMLMGAASVYSFEFDITENNKANGDLAFSLPFTGPKVLTGGASASLELTRAGSRAFTTGDRWGNLVIKSTLCADVGPRPGNLVYPLDGSIGVGRVVRTFIDISDQGGAKDSFVDTLTFTTKVGGDANASIKLAAVSHSFRLVSASADLSGSRLDIHKMTVSLVFPHPPAPEAITGVERSDGDLNAPFSRPPAWRARYNLCVSDGRAREDSHNTLRLEAPEVYCIKYADSFAPLDGPEAKPQPVVVVVQSPGSPTLAPPPPPQPTPFSRRRTNSRP